MCTYNETATICMQSAFLPASELFTSAMLPKSSRGLRCQTSCLQGRRGGPILPDYYAYPVQGMHCGPCVTSNPLTSELAPTQKGAAVADGSPRSSSGARYQSVTTLWV